MYWAISRRTAPRPDWERADGPDARLSRSPYDMLAGLVMLPRTADKVRARQRDALGEYIYPCPLDEILLGFLGLDGDELVALVNRADDDNALEELLARRAPRTIEERNAFNNKMRHLVPQDEEGRQWLAAKQDELARRDYFTYFDQLDAEEGRF